MRRTVKKGWTAKAVRGGGANASLIDLEEEDELVAHGSETESIDSFFDDDFDDQTKEQALGKMLSCNTLGVESKVSLHEHMHASSNLQELKVHSEEMHSICSPCSFAKN